MRASNADGPPRLTLRLKRKHGGASALTLERADGTTTWQRQERHAEFFAHHDLTHFAVETTLALHGAFYGLVASGWEFDDFSPPYPRGPIPREALWAETVVGMLDAERASRAAGGEALDADTLNAQVRSKFAAALVEPPREVTAAELAAIHAARATLFDRWWTTPEGETLTLVFAPAPR